MKCVAFFFGGGGHLRINHRFHPKIKNKYQFPFIFFNVLIHYLWVLMCYIITLWYKGSSFWYWQCGQTWLPTCSIDNKSNWYWSIAWVYQIGVLGEVIVYGKCCVVLGTLSTGCPMVHRYTSNLNVMKADIKDTLPIPTMSWKQTLKTHFHLPQCHESRH